MSEPAQQGGGYTPAKKSSLWRTTKSIAWAFFGVRRGNDYREDIQNLNIFHIIFVGIAACFIFVIGLMFFVHWVVT